MSLGIQEVGSYSRSRELLYVDFNEKKKKNKPIDCQETNCEETISWPSARGEQNQFGRWKWGLGDIGIHCPPKNSKVKIITREPEGECML